MREIKVRAWDKFKKEMYYDWGHDSGLGQCLWLNMFGNITDSQAKQNGYSIPCSAAWHDNIVFMESTGLKDKNEIEIYEGDILTSITYPFQDDGEYNYHGVVEWIDDLASFYITKRLVNKNKRGISDGMSEQIEDIEEFEVIGNIYKNPELLEV